MKTICSQLSILACAAAFLLFCGTPALSVRGDDKDDDDDKRAAKRHFVDDDKAECPGAAFMSIQSAIDAASPGDTIHVCPGTYDEQLVIAKRLTLEGEKRNGKNAAVVQPSRMVMNATDTFGSNQAAVILVTETSGVTIKNLIVDGINNGVECALADEEFLGLEGILFLFASGRLESVVVRNILSPGGCAFGFGIDYQSGDRRTHLSIRDSSIHNYDIAGIFAFGSRSTLHVLRNVITGLGSTSLGQLGIQIFSGTTGVIQDNVITNHIFSCPNFDCGFVFVSHAIGVFETSDVKIIGNIVGSSNTAIFAGIPEAPVSGVRLLENRVFDSNSFDFDGIVLGGTGIHVSGKHNILKDNLLTNSKEAAIFVTDGNNTGRDNTINEAAIGLLAAAGNKFSDNRFFNTTVVRELFDPGLTLATSLRASSTGTPERAQRRQLRNPR